MIWLNGEHQERHHFRERVEERHNISKSEFFDRKPEVPISS